MVPHRVLVALRRLCVALMLLEAAASVSACGDPSVSSGGGIQGSDGGAGHGNSAGSSSTAASAGSSGVGDLTNLGAGGASGTDGCPSTCEALNANCGFVTDEKCGGVAQCGKDCPKGQFCGGNGPNRCGTGTGESQCQPSTCAELNANCGFATDPKCGGTIDCGGACPKGEICGLGGPSKCGPGQGQTTCMVDPNTTCEGRGVTCGSVADNCGNQLDCWPAGVTSCPGAGEVCLHNKCVAGGCVSDPAMSCAARGYSCGLAADNCGNQLVCGPLACDNPNQTCGGGVDQDGKPVLGVCGCQGACASIPSCPAGKTTQLSGKVYDPAGLNPLYHVLVYVANDPSDPDLATFPAGVSCDVCGASAAGSPLISDPGRADPPAGTYTAADGSFTLDNVPVGKGVTLVIQLGRWRRVFKVDVDNACAPNALADGTLRMPSKQSEGNIPQMALVTGKFDRLECVLRGMGIDDSEFTNPSGGGRVHLYQGIIQRDPNNIQAGAGYIDASTPGQHELFAQVGSDPRIESYDMTLLACQGTPYGVTSDPEMKNLRGYAAHGGRVFATHYNHPWLATNDADPAAAAGTADNWSEVAKWKPNQLTDEPSVAQAFIDKTNPKGEGFQAWLEAVGASDVGSGFVTLHAARRDTDGVLGATTQWLYRKSIKSSDNVPVHFTFNTPVNLKEDLTLTPPAVQCGRVLFSDFHVEEDFTRGYQFPSGCGKACKADADCAGRCQNGYCRDPLTAQGKVLEFMIFDLGSCVPPSACVPLEACPDTRQECGYAPDGCGGLIECGKCTNGEVCGAGSPPVANHCGNDTCTKLAQCPAGQECGYASDGCSDVLSCGTCPPGQFCDGGKCTGQKCTPKSCVDQGIECGKAGDGCGGPLTCPDCPDGSACVKGKCEPQSCVPLTCDGQGLECGPAGDGCGRIIPTCGECRPGDLCVAGHCLQVK